MTLVEQIKARKPIGPFVAKHTGGLEPSTGNFMTGICPFHQSDKKKRTFWVDIERGICGCHVPRCQAGAPAGKPMDVINFYARLHNISNAEAIERLAAEVGLSSAAAAFRQQSI